MTSVLICSVMIHAIGRPSQPNGGMITRDLLKKVHSHCALYKTVLKVVFLFHFFVLYQFLIRVSSLQIKARVSKSHIHKAPHLQKVHKSHKLCKSANLRISYMRTAPPSPATTHKYFSGCFIVIFVSAVHMCNM
jgi:hypothetical protein